MNIVAPYSVHCCNSIPD